MCNLPNDKTGSNLHFIASIQCSKQSEGKGKEEIVKLIPKLEAMSCR